MQRCQWCQANPHYAVVDRYVSHSNQGDVVTYLCDDCACDAGMDAPEPVMQPAMWNEVPLP